MRTVSTTVAALMLIFVTLLCCVPSAHSAGELDIQRASERAPRLQAVPRTVQPNDIASVPHGKLLLELVVVLGAWWVVGTALIGYHRQYHVAHDILTPREFVLVCMQDQDGKKR